MGGSCPCGGGWDGGGEGVWDARACHLSARDDGTSSDASPPWTQLAGHTPRPSQNPNVLPAQTNVKPHTFTQDLETGPKREIQGPVTNQDSNLPPPQATPINQLQKIWRRQLSAPPPPKSPQLDTGGLYPDTFRPPCSRRGWAGLCQGAAKLEPQPTAHPWGAEGSGVLRSNQAHQRVLLVRKDWGVWF